MTPLLKRLICCVISFYIVSVSAQNSTLSTIITELESVNDNKVLEQIRGISENMERSRLLINILAQSVHLGDTQLAQLETFKTTFSQNRETFQQLERYSLRFGNLVPLLDINIEIELDNLAIELAALLTDIRELSTSFATRDTLKIEDLLL